MAGAGKKGSGALSRRGRRVLSLPGGRSPWGALVERVAGDDPEDLEEDPRDLSAVPRGETVLDPDGCSRAPRRLWR